VIKENLRTMDVAARYGGEEFVVVLPETGIAGAFAVAERIRQGVEALRIEGPHAPHAAKTISVGVATFPDHAASSLRLLESADAAMYRAKRAGKNRVASAGT
jgi:diguanylate cyclase (GGDEF)-like protein